MISVAMEKLLSFFLSLNYLERRERDRAREIQRGEIDILPFSAKLERGGESFFLLPPAIGVACEILGDQRRLPPSPR